MGRLHDVYVFDRDNKSTNQQTTPKNEENNTIPHLVQLDTYCFDNKEKSHIWNAQEDNSSWDQMKERYQGNRKLNTQH